MTSQERELIVRFLQQLTEARAGQKDSEAEKLIQEACARQPDAAYLLVQRALQLDQAFQATQAEALKLQTELDKARTSASASSGSSGGFLNDPNAWGSTPRASVAQSGASRAAVPAQPAAPVRAPTPWGGGGMLGAVATTAAGVVAGSFLFQGIQGLMNRDEPQASGEKTHSAQSEPEHVAQRDTMPEELGDSYADSGGGDSGDFA